MNTIKLVLLDYEDAASKSYAKRFDDLLISNKATYTKTINGGIVEFEVECNIELSYVIIELLTYQSMSTYKPQI